MPHAISTCLHRLAAVLVLAGWLAASGALLEVAQVFAWCRMFAGYAGTYSVAEAAARTFDPTRPCPICRALQKAERKQHEAPPAAPNAATERPILICERAEPMVFARQGLAWEVQQEIPACGPVRAVPVPPPRGEA
jgi:hypothetical protein